MTSGTQGYRYCATVLLLMFMTVLSWTGAASARSSVWISSRDSNACIVSAVFQYDKKFEANIQKENSMSNAVLRMDINTREPAELCSTLMMVQGENRWRPLICVKQARGAIYKGYLVLPEEFVLYRPIEIYLGDRRVDANFIQ